MDDLDYGGRAKIGLIYPAMGWVMEPEFTAMAPKGVSIQTTRVMNGSTDKEGLNDLIIAGTKQAASLLAAIPTDILMFGCTSASFCNGVEYEKKYDCGNGKRVWSAFCHDFYSCCRGGKGGRCEESCFRNTLY